MPALVSIITDALLPTGLDDWAMTRRATIASTSDQGRN
ncbi:hypothetical protein PVAP13_1KG193500 [Panicum virgatum]|uniref:Uncharacterized protein n=1 Tax=Panicum virgatum TaxID=38727 RepID=A0A8T0X6C9_PANVG|nr:hypothetical protein PVAP13_1KG193500 [Panicum virgatum]